MIDAAFEQSWADREHSFTDYIMGQLAGRWKWIPNVGAWITTRDPSDCSNVDGVMIEDFAKWDADGYFAPGDWTLQMNRALGLIGAHTYISLDMGTRPAWFPEYGIDLGPAVDPLPSDIAAYWNPAWSVYVRHCAKGLVLVNPTTAHQTVTLPGAMWRVDPDGGGPVPSDGSAPGALTYTAAQTVAVGAHRAAILLHARPTGAPAA